MKSLQHQQLEVLVASPAVPTSAEKLELTETQQLDFSLTAGAFGLVIANASISGAEGGCQVEVGS